MNDRFRYFLKEILDCIGIWKNFCSRGIQGSFIKGVQILGEGKEAGGV